MQTTSIVKGSVLRANLNATTEPATKPTFDQFIKAYERVIMGAVRLDKPDDPRRLIGDGLFPRTRTYPRTARVALPDKGSFAYNVLPARIGTLANRLSKV